MFLNPTLSAALDRIAERAADVRRAFSPGAQPQRSDVASGSVRADATLDPLSVVAPDGAYFVTGDASGRIGYTRNGSFSIAGGALVDAGGREVLGVASPAGTLGALRIDPVDAALGRATQVGLAPDGSLTYRRIAIDPRSGARDEQRVTVGRIALARFPAGTQLETGDGDRRFAPAGITAHTGVAGDGNFGALVPMMRERSRVDLDASLARLKDAYVAFDALQAAETVRGHLSKTAMDLLK